MLIRPHVGCSAIILDLVVSDPRRNILRAHRVLQRCGFIRHMYRVESFRLFRANRVRLEARGGLHGDEREQLEQMVRHHVAQGAGCIVEAPAATDGERLGHGDLHMIDMIAIPDGLEQSVCESQHQDVLHRLLSEVMVDAIDLVFFEQPEELSIERLRRGEIGAERFLDNQATPRPVLLASETRLTKMATDRRE